MKMDIPAFKHCFIGGTSVLTAYKIQDFFDSIFQKVYGPNKKAIWYVLARLVIKIIANYTLPLYYKITKPQKEGKYSEIIVSLTSFPARIKSVWIVIECIKRQTLRPKKIILWLSKEQFNDKRNLPNSLLKLEDEIFQIRFIEGNLRSHKKYYYAFKEYSDNPIVTIDDDTLYSSHLLEELNKESLLNPDCVICNSGHVISREKMYTEWDSVEIRTKDVNILPIGISGVLYPPHIYDKHIFDIDAIQKCCFNADDLWLNFMCRLNGATTVKTKLGNGWLPILKAQNYALTKTNGKFGGNDLQIASISDWAIKHLGVDFYYRCSNCENKSLIQDDIMLNHEENISFGENNSVGKCCVISTWPERGVIFGNYSQYASIENI